MFTLECLFLLLYSVNDLAYHGKHEGHELYSARRFLYKEHLVFRLGPSPKGGSEQAMPTKTAAATANANGCVR
jgi:hypothetical protein